MHKRKSKKLIAGISLLSIFIIIALFGPSLAPYEDTYSKKIDYIQTPEGEKMVSSPFPPTKKFIFGTDKWGYDILSLTLYGAKYTVFITLIVAFVRVLIGGLAGIFAALNEVKAKRRGSTITVLSAVPNFIIIYFVMLGVNINSPLSKAALLMIPAILMIVLGISGVYQVVFSKTMELKTEQYVLAAQTLGGGKLHLLRKHILPALLGNMLIIAVSEAVLVLHLIGQLGIFNLFIGGTVTQIGPPTLYISVLHEWSGLIGQARGFMYHSQWIILFPLLVYILFLFSLYLVSAGLNEVQRSRERKPGLL